MNMKTCLFTIGRNKYLEKLGEKKRRRIHFILNPFKKNASAKIISIFLILAAFTVLFIVSQPKLHQKLYTAYFIPFRSYTTNNGAEIAEQNLWGKALFHYEKGEYDKALEVFNNIAIHNYRGTINHPGFQLYQGNSLMMLHRHAEARSTFKGMLEADTGMIIQAKWYLSLCS